jgi:hypothetical protein
MHEMADQLDTAADGDQILGSDLQESIDLLRGLASGLDDAMTADLTVLQMQSLGKLQTQLRELAGSLVTKQIDLLAGEAKVAAGHIDAAVRFANGVIEKTVDLKGKLDKVAALLEFFSAVTTGNGNTIVQAATTLKSKLGSD